MDWDGIEQENHNPLYGYTAGADGVKTGFTNEAGYGFVGSAIRNGRRIIMVVGADKPALRAKQSRDFMEWGFAAWRIGRCMAPARWWAKRACAAGQAGRCG
jgi:D-alanyl-D-alanine carboxypeptidase (penicillin-binding protein 5/6)